MLVLLVVACSGPEPGVTPQAVEPQQIYQWRMVTTWPKNLPGLGTAPERMAENIRTMSQGRLNIKVYGAGEVVPALEVFEAVSQGTVQMGHGAAYYWRGKVPIAQFFTAVPFGLTAQEMNGWLLHGGGMELWRKLYARYNLVPIPGGNTGVQMAGWFNREINSLDDFKGLKMRMPGLGGMMITKLGASVVGMPGGQIYENLVNGTIDACEWVGPWNDERSRFYEAAKYYLSLIHI